MKKDNVLPSKGPAKKMPTPSKKNLAKSLQLRTTAKDGAKVKK